MAIAGVFSCKVYYGDNRRDGCHLPVKKEKRILIKVQRLSLTFATRRVCKGIMVLYSRTRVLSSACAALYLWLCIPPTNRYNLGL